MTDHLIANENERRPSLIEQARYDDKLASRSVLHLQQAVQIASIAAKFIEDVVIISSVCH